MSAVAAARHANQGVQFGHHGRDAAVSPDPRLDLSRGFTPTVGDRVRVIDADAQLRVQLGPPRFPGRIGIVERVPAGYDMAYVRLDPTARGKERVECFGSRLLKAA